MMKKVGKFAGMLMVLSLLLGWGGAAAAETPKWRILWIILPRLSVSHGGVNYSFSLTDEEMAKIREMGARTERFIEEASNNAVDIEMSFVTSIQTVTSLTEDTYLHVGEDDFPSDIKEEIRRSDPHLKVATYRLDGTSQKINNYWGLGGGTYAKVRFLDVSNHQLSETCTCPEEVWIHELLHCFEWFYNTVLGYPMPGTHDAEKNGYQSVNDSFAAYYRDIFAGRVRDASGDYIGITREMWAHNPSNEDISGQGYSYSVVPLGLGGCNAGFMTLPLLLLVGLPLGRRALRKS